MDEFRGRQISLIQVAITDYRTEKIGLSTLIGRVEAVGRLLGGTFWDELLFPLVLELELINSELIDKQRSASKQEQKLIDSTLRRLGEVILEN